MDPSPALPSQIQQALARGSTVLTANQRAARTLRRDFDLRQFALGLAHWQPPQVLAWDTWLASLWHSLLMDGHTSELLLSSTQEHTIWRAIIGTDAATSSLRPLDSLAQTAADAWRLLHSYRGRSRLRDYAGNTDTRTFERWAAEFERHCRHSQYLTLAQLPETLRTALIAGHIALPPEFFLVGFDAQTPAQTALIDAIRAAGTSIDELQSGPTAASPILTAVPDEHAELTVCARWLRTRLAAEPASRLAVIVPALETARAEIDRVFRAVLAPELSEVSAPVGSGPCEFSLGVALAATPMVATALDILRWATGPLAIDRVSALLLSPHFAATSPLDDPERLARAVFDAFDLRQRHLLQPETSLDTLLRFVSQSRFLSGLPVLLNHLLALRTSFSRRELGERTHADWANSVHELLEAAGWAPPTHLNSVEFQTRRKWESALDELATLDFDNVRIRFADAVVALERIATETLFAPESRHAPIQIMGPLEAAGSTFDAIWFLHADDMSWPASPAPNPLLPWQLQRDLAMPGATPALDAAHGRRIIQRIAASAPTVLFSYAQQSVDGPQRRSPALSGLTLEIRSPAGIVPAGPAPTAIQLTTVADSAAPPPPQGHVFQGGSAILQLQAACSFRAFAEKRLFASSLDPASLGLDAGERGSLVHAVLESFWAQVGTQAALKSMSVAQRDSQLARSIDESLARHNAAVQPGWSRAYVDAERQRLLNLLRPWLDYEAGRRSAFAVKSREQKLDDVQIGPLHLDIRVDRIDTALVDGKPAGEIILDYKTGTAKPAEWLGERPDEPQLPLYAVVSATPDLAAVAFANVRRGTDMGLHGYQSREGVLPRAAKLKTESLAAQVNRWREVLTTLAERFYSGDALVSPRLYPQTCAYCQQRILCRLDPSALDADTIEDSDAESDASDPETDLG